MRAPRITSCGGVFMGRREPVCRAHRRFGMMRAASFPSEAPGLHGAAPIVRYVVATEPPAHCRLVRATIFQKTVAFADCTARGGQRLSLHQGRPAWCRRPGPTARVDKW